MRHARSRVALLYVSRSYLNVTWPCYFQFTNLSKIENVEFLEQWFYGGLTDLQGLYIYNVDRDVQENWSAGSKKGLTDLPTRWKPVFVLYLIVQVIDYFSLEWFLEIIVAFFILKLNVEVSKRKI